MVFDQIENDAGKLKSAFLSIHGHPALYHYSLDHRMTRKDIDDLVLERTLVFSTHVACDGILDSDKRYFLVVKTPDLGGVVFAGRYEHPRNLTGPMVVYHVKDFDMIDFELPMLSKTREQVIEQYRTAPEVVESEGLTPVFIKLLESVNLSLIKMME